MTVSIKQFVNVAVVGQNLIGPAPPATSLKLDPFVVAPDSLDRKQVSLLSDFPRTLAHGLAIFPTRQNGFSLNFDGLYDFTSFRHQDKYTRMTSPGGAEYTIKGTGAPAPRRLLGQPRARQAGHRGFIACRIGFVRDAPKRGSASTFGVGFLAPGHRPQPRDPPGRRHRVRLDPQWCRGDAHLKPA